MASFRMISLLLHKTSQFHITNVKGNIFGRALNHPSFIFIDLILYELQGEGIKRLHLSEKTKTNPLWIEKSETTFSFLQAWQSQGIRIEGCLLVCEGGNFCETCEGESEECHGARYLVPFSPEFPHFEVRMGEISSERRVHYNPSG